MPHCIIEYSQELAEEIDIKSLMSVVFQGAVQSSLFAVTDIKVRAIAFNDFYAESTNSSSKEQPRFIHVCCKILSGRTLEQRQKLSLLILSQLTELSINAVSISVEIVDMECESYNKHISE